MNPLSINTLEVDTYLVGADGLVRSNTRFSIDKYSVQESFKYPDLSKINTESVSKALTGESGILQTLNYNGLEVLSAYKPVMIFDQKWPIITETSVDHKCMRILFLFFCWSF